VAKVEHNRYGHNLRLVVTNKTAIAQEIYELDYCLRGDMENDIKQQKLDLRSDRSSSHEFMANQFRMLLSGFAYSLFNHLMHVYLKNTQLAKSYCHTIRIKLLKIGAIIIKNTRSIKLLFSNTFANQELFTQIINKINSS